MELVKFVMNEEMDSLGLVNTVSMGQLDKKTQIELYEVAIQLLKEQIMAMRGKKNNKISTN